MKLHLDTRGSEGSRSAGGFGILAPLPTACVTLSKVIDL